MLAKRCDRRTAAQVRSGSSPPPALAGQHCLPVAVKVWGTRALSVRGGAVTDACDATLPAQGPVWSLAVLPGGGVVSGGEDGSVRAWQ